MASGYDLIALDLDGTLLDASGRVCPESVRAIERARDAGVRVVVCTGRGLVETRRVLEALGYGESAGANGGVRGGVSGGASGGLSGGGEPIIVAGGAIVADARTSQTLHRFSLSPEIVAGSVEILNEAGHAALVLKDRAAAGYDYLVVSGEQGHAIDPVTTWWFNELHVEARFCTTIDEDEHPEQSVRVGVCSRCGEVGRLIDLVVDRFGDRVMTLTFSAVAAPDAIRLDESGRRFEIMEVFDARASKWSAIEWLCGHLGIDPARTAAIGDEMNDVAMIRGAGLGVAMGNAVPEVVASSDRQTRANTEAGVAHAIERILRGEW